MQHRRRTAWSWTVLFLLCGAAWLPAQERETKSGWWRGQPVTYQVVNGWAMIEGDILIGRAGEIPAGPPTNVEDKGAPPVRESVAVSDPAFLWPGGVIPFTIDPTLPDQQRIFDAIHEWNTRTPLTFAPRSAETNYIHFQDDNTGCNSFVGMVGGRQEINIQPDCNTGNTIHEIGHAAGLFHEQSRSDRDQHVVILCHNITEPERSQFSIAGTIAQDVLDYDYRSIMHYGEFAFAVGGPAIATIPAGIPIGQRDGLSEIDINAIDFLYSTPASGTTVQTNPPGLQIVVDGHPYTAPQTFDWAIGELHEISAPLLQTKDATTYAFAKWSNGVPDTQMFRVETKRKAIVASFRDAAVIEPTSTAHVAPANPVPASGSGGVPATNVVLRWDAACGAISYDIYLGIVEPVLVATDVAQSYYAVGDLAPNETFSWKIVAKNVYGDSSGTSATWTFTTTSTVTLPDFVPTSVTAPTIVPATGPIPLSSTLLNQGAAAGAAVDLEFFLSPDANVTTADDSLGSCSVGPLGNNQVGVCALTAPAPAHVGEGLYYIAAIADPNDAITEASESNNLRLADTGIMTLGDCTYTVSVSAQNIESAPLGGGFVVGTQPGCAWNARSLNTWIEITTGFNGIGTGVGTFFVDENPNDEPRTGNLFIGGQTITISQLGTSSFFSDVPSTAFYFDAVNLMKEFQITDGCSDSPPQFCPDDKVTRGQMAVFIIRSIFGSDDFKYSTTPRFSDVDASHPFFKWIQKLATLGITKGCAPGKFCPEDYVTRGQMAVFIIRMRYGENTIFTPPASQLFSDVPPGHQFYSWIQELGELTVTTGCGGGAYCPDAFVTRGQMAVFIIRGGFNRLLTTVAPYIKSVSPSQANEGESVTVTLSGQDTHFVAGVSAARQGQDYAAGPVTVISPTTALVTITVGPAVTPGNKSITIYTGTEEATIPNGFIIIEVP